MLLRKGFSKQTHFYEIDYHEIMHIRTKFILKLLENGISVLISDIDGVWLNNPLPYLLSNRNLDIIGQNDGSEDEKMLCGGISFSEITYSSSGLV